MRPQTELSRCFIVPEAEPVSAPKKRGGGGGKRGKRLTWRDLMNPGVIEALDPYAHPSLTFDIETTVTAHSGQQVKVGFCQERGLRSVERQALFAEGILTPQAMDYCWREAVFYNPDTCSEEEQATIKKYAMDHQIECMTVQEFIKKVLYRMEYLDDRRTPEPKLIIGHNPVFDLGALAHHTSGCRSKKMYGGLSLALCDCRKDEIAATGEFKKCGYHGNIRLKKINPGKHFYEVSAKYNGLDKTGQKKWVYTELEFVDTRQLAGALLGATCDKRLGSLCAMLKTSHQKMETQGHGLTIDETYLDYAHNDVHCTWDLWVKLRNIYKKYGLPTRITKIVSEASIGKSIFKKFGIQSFFGYDHKLKRNTRNLDFDLRDFGAAAEGYYGGNRLLGYAIRSSSACCRILEVSIRASTD